jgi:hypothetical protein
MTLHQKVAEILDLLKYKEEDNLLRIGSSNDGGYVLQNMDFSKVFLISGGIETNNDFELSLAALGAEGIQVDYSISQPPVSHPNLIFEPLKIVGKVANKEHLETTIDDIYRRFSSRIESQKLKPILKLDIEGSEWEALESCANLDKFDQIVVEFHNLHLLAVSNNLFQAREVLSKLSRTHKPVFVTGNNCCGFVTIGGHPVPKVIEATFSRREINDTKVSTIRSRDLNPGNIIGRAPLEIRFN